MSKLFDIIRSLFKSDKTANKIIESQSLEIGYEEFKSIEYVQEFIKNRKRTSTILNPRKDLSNNLHSSFMGGSPNLSNFSEYPLCDCCNSPLNFVLQLDKTSFPEFFWPDNKIYFQLFRCPNYDCKDAFDETSNYDLKMFHFYFETLNSHQVNFTKPNFEIKDRETEVVKCVFNPVKKSDYPSFFETDEVGYKNLEKKYGGELTEQFEEEYSPIQRTKIGGYPSFTQNEYYPICECGKEKTFLFQLSSQDNDGTESSKEFSDDDYWSHHRIMIGDVGNIYYFICEDCKEKSIQSYWDCC